jgi:hypothetical protein
MSEAWQAPPRPALQRGRGARQDAGSRSDERLPLVENAVLGRVAEDALFVNAVAKAVTFQPLELPEESLIAYVWSPDVLSTSCWSRPFTAAPQPRDAGEVRAVRHRATRRVAIALNPVIAPAVPG